MPDPGTTERSLIWRLLPWLVPLALILVGLMFVAAGVTTSGSKPGPARDVAPANVIARFTTDAPTWASAQVGPTVTATVVKVIVVSAAATGSSTYSARAVIVRHDAAIQPATAPGETLPTLAEADRSTVATCVLWDIDVTSQVSTPRAALEIEREVGIHDLSATDDAISTLRDRCRDAVLG